MHSSTEFDIDKSGTTTSLIRPAGRTDRRVRCDIARTLWAVRTWITVSGLLLHKETQQHTGQHECFCRRLEAMRLCMAKAHQDDDVTRHACTEIRMEQCQLAISCLLQKAFAPLRD